MQNPDIREGSEDFAILLRWSAAMKTESRCGHQPAGRTGAFFVQPFACAFPAEHVTAGHQTVSPNHELTADLTLKLSFKCLERWILVPFGCGIGGGPLSHSGLPQGRHNKATLAVTLHNSAEGKRQPPVLAKYSTSNECPDLISRCDGSWLRKNNSQDRIGYHTHIYHFRSRAGQHLSYQMARDNHPLSWTSSLK